MLRAVVRWGTRAATGAVAALAACCLYVGWIGLAGAATFLPWPWNPPAGLAGIGGMYLGGLFGAAGVLFTGLGLALGTAAWGMAGAPRPQRRRTAPPRPNDALQPTSAPES